MEEGESHHVPWEKRLRKGGMEEHVVWSHKPLGEEKWRDGGRGYMEKEKWRTLAGVKVT